MSISMNKLKNSQDSNGASRKKYMLINAFEEIVLDNVQQLMEQESNMCKCEKCYLDVCALVFNSNRNNYVRFVTTRAGELLTQVPEMSYYNKTEMTVIVLDAIRMVKESPQHSDQR